MKQNQLRLFGIFFALLAVHSISAAASDELHELFEKRQYFELRDKLTTKKGGTGGSVLFYRAVVENKFNRPDRSIVLVEKFLRSARQDTEPKMIVEAYTLLADNYVKTYRYGKAAAVYELILAKFAGSLSAQEKAGYQNVRGLWKPLAQVPPQTVKVREDSSIQADRKPVGLYVPLEINGRKESFIFDTGANISTIIESTAKELGLDLYESDIEVGSISGNTVRSRLGVAKQLRIGNVTLINVVFLVFPDESLFVKPLNFQIHGILGFPVIEALGEVTWTRDKRIIIPAKPGRSDARNLALDGLTPLIRGSYGGRTMTFAFDTGASKTSLYPLFFEAFEKEISSAGEPFMQRLTGAGGSRDVKAWKLKDAVMEFAGKRSTFKTLEVSTERSSAASDYFYGNIGRDMIDQFERMTINFEAMYITLE